MAFPIMAIAYIAKGLSDMGDARAQGVIDKYEAMKAIEIGERMAGNIRREGSAAIGSAVRAMAGSGVSSAAGTGALILQDIKRRSEADAMAAVLTGYNQAQAIKYRSKQQQNQAAVSAGESFAKAFYTYQQDKK